MNACHAKYLYHGTMFRIGGSKKHDPHLRWGLPDRTFFACGACHILAYAFLERYPAPSHKAIWLKPDSGFTGNHISVAGDGWIFDYHGYSGRERFLAELQREPAVMVAHDARVQVAELEDGAERRPCAGDDRGARDRHVENIARHR